MAHHFSLFFITKYVISHAGVAELVDALDLGSSVFDVGVRVPSPASLKYLCGSSSVVEYDLAKVGVAGSNPVFRSILIRGRGGIGRRARLRA